MTDRKLGAVTRTWTSGNGECQLAIGEWRSANHKWGSASLEWRGAHRESLAARLE